MFFIASLSFSQTRNVTFVVNSATVPDTVSPAYTMQLRGNTPPLTWGNDTGGRLINIGGDYWSKTLAFTVGDTVRYKILAGTNGWESDVIPDPPLLPGDRNRAYIVADHDTVLPVQFFNNGSSSRSQYFRPWTQVADSFMNVFVRVNMAGIMLRHTFGFDNNRDTLGIRGDGPAGGDLNWSPTFYLTQESPAANGGFTYPSNVMWSARLRIPKGGVSEGQSFQYKFLIGYEWGRDELQGQPNRTFTIPAGKKDTTLSWVYFNNDREGPYGGDTVITLWSANMQQAVRDRSFSIGDTLVVRYGFNPEHIDREKQLVRQGLSLIYITHDYYLVVPTQRTLYYRYYVVKNGVYNSEIVYCPYVGSCDRRFDIPIEVSTAVIRDTNSCQTCDRRVPRFLIPRRLAHDVNVRWAVDVRPAWYQVAAGDTLRDIQGNFDITNRDSVIGSGVWINGLATGSWQSWGIPLQQDTSRRMYDDGTHGDQVAGDSIFTRMILASPDSIGVGTKGQIGQVFKFSLKGGDNEGGPGGFGSNHQANINDSLSEYTMSEQWGSVNPTFYRCWDYDNRRPLSCLTGVSELPTIRPAYELYQNYPNPFNPVTNIRYTLRSENLVTLRVYNVLGQEMATLVNERQKAANHSVTFDGSRVASGVYFYRITAGEFVSSRKMIVLK